MQKYKPTDITKRRGGYLYYYSFYLAAISTPNLAALLYERLFARFPIFCPFLKIKIKHRLFPEINLDRRLVLLTGLSPPIVSGKALLSVLHIC